MSHDWIGPLDIHKPAMISGPQPQPPDWWKSLGLVTFGEWKWERMGTYIWVFYQSPLLSKSWGLRDSGGSESDGGCWTCQWEESFQQRALDLNESRRVWSGSLSLEKETETTSLCFGVSCLLDKIVRYNSPTWRSPRKPPCSSPDAL